MPRTVCSDGEPCGEEGDAHEPQFIFLSGLGFRMCPGCLLSRMLLQGRMM